MSEYHQVIQLCIYSVYIALYYLEFHMATLQIPAYFSILGPTDEFIADNKGV